MRTRPYSFSLILLLLALVCGRATAQSTGSAGILILGGISESSTAFDSIQWVNTDGGYVTDHAGNKTSFSNTDVRKIVYFDQSYYDEVDHNQYWVDWRAGIQSREIVLAPINTISLSQADLAGLQSQDQTVEDLAQRYASSRTLLAPFIDTLKQDIAHLSNGSVLCNGKWMSQKDADAMGGATPVIGGARQTVTFTTKDGKTYSNVQVSITDDGLSILTADGGASVPFDQLPADLSPFPQVIRDQITARMKQAEAVTAPAPATPIAPSAPPAKGFFASATPPGLAPAKPPAPAAPTPKPAPAVAKIPAPPPAPPTPSAPPAGPPAILDSSAVVLVKGEIGEGTGFLVKTPNGPVIFTNLHVIAGNPNVKFYTNTGAEIVPISMWGASDRDLAMFTIQDNHYTYLQLADNVEKTVAANDATVVPGNSEGGEVTLVTNGNLLGLGPERVEFSNPVYHGNSGSPVFDVRTGKVIGVASFAAKLIPEDEVDKNSYASSLSAIKGPIRYFGLRIDTVPKWLPYNMANFVNEGLFLKDFDDVNRALDVFCNGEKNAEGHSIVETPPGRKFYETSKKIKDAYDAYHEATGNRQSAAQELVWLLGTVTDDGYLAIKNPTGFYPYDQPLARQELDYRDHLKTEISDVQSKINVPGPESGL